MDEYRDLKKDLEQTAKNCRIIQFKLRKAERRIEQLETEKHQLDVENQELRSNAPSSTKGASGQNQSGQQDRITQLEHELSQAREQLLQAQREVQKLQTQINRGTTASSGPVLSKSRSLEVKLLVESPTARMSFTAWLLGNKCSRVPPFFRRYLAVATWSPRFHGKRSRSPWAAQVRRRRSNFSPS